jgi:hypothetical protein
MIMASCANAFFNFYLENNYKNGHNCTTIKDWAKLSTDLKLFEFWRFLKKVPLLSNKFGHGVHLLAEVIY